MTGTRLQVHVHPLTQKLVPRSHSAAFYSHAPTLLGFCCCWMTQGWRRSNAKFESDARGAGDY
jgi:hypothetical protein